MGDRTLFPVTWHRATGARRGAAAPGHDGMDFSEVAGYCEKLGVEYHIIPSDISKVVFEYRKEHNPCSLCAKMRRGALNNAAHRLGCNKVALGHHFDDVVETFMLNLFYEGRIGVFSPVTYLSRSDVTVIRPMIYMPEKDIRYFAKKTELPVVESTCPANGNTEREEMKKFLARLDRENRGLKYRIYGAIQRGGVDVGLPLFQLLLDACPDGIRQLTHDGALLSGELAHLL